MKRDKFLNPAIYSFIFGIVGILAFAPFHLYPLMLVSLTGLIWIFHKSNKTQAFRYGFYYGLGFFGFGVSWVYVSLHTFGETSVILAGLLTLFFIAVLALVPASTGWLLNRFYPKNTSVKLWLAFPAIWTLMEWVRSWLFSGFPWVLAGSSQLYWPFNTLAPVAGTYTISFMLAQFAGGLVYYFHASTTHRRNTLIYFFVVLCICTGLALLTWTKPQPNPINVSLVQGNILPSLKWQETESEHALQNYMQLSQPHWDNQLVIWPEAAITTPLPFANTEFNPLRHLANQHHAGFITGIPYEGVHMEMYNAAVSAGDAHGSYFKQHLVPFGEYFPMPKITRPILHQLHIPMSNFTPGATQQETIHYQNARIATFICYEIIFPDEVRSAAVNANVLLEMSDDAWFGHSFAASQHLQMAQMRALETGRYVLSVTNNGITAVINTQGKIVKRLPQNESGVLSAEIPLYAGDTPWMKYGSNIYLVLCLLSLFIAKIREKKAPLLRAEH